MCRTTLAYCPSPEMLRWSLRHDLQILFCPSPPIINSMEVRCLYRKGKCLSLCLPPRPPGAMSRATGVLIINIYFPLHHPHQAPVQDSSVPGCCDEGSPNPGDCCCGMWSGIGRALGGSENLWLESHFQPQRDVSQKDVHPPYLRTWKLPHSEAFAKDFDHEGSRFWGEKGKHSVEVGRDGLWGGTEVNGAHVGDWTKRKGEGR